MGRRVESGVATPAGQAGAAVGVLVARAVAAGLLLSVCALALRLWVGCDASSWWIGTVLGVALAVALAFAASRVVRTVYWSQHR